VSNHELAKLLFVHVPSPPAVGIAAEIVRTDREMFNRYRGQWKAADPGSEEY